MKKGLSLFTNISESWFSIGVLSICLITASCLDPLLKHTNSDYLPIGLVSVVSCFLLLTCFDKSCLKQTLSFSKGEALLLTFFAYTLINGRIHGSVRTPLQYWKWIGALLFFISGKRLSRDREALLIILSGIALVQATVVLLQRTGILHSHSFFFPVSGTYGNPQYPAAIICMGLSVLLDHGFRYFGKHTLATNFSIITIASILLSALVCCGTRSCYFALLVVIVILVYRAYSKKKILVFSSIILISGIFILYSIRPESANVRLLIWRVGLSMFSSHPLFGNGPCSFANNYMISQAAFFASHPSSLFTILANNHSQPYNEPLRLLCEQGIVGLLLVAFAFYGMLSKLNRSYIPLVCLITISLTFNVSDLFVLYLMFWFLIGFASNGQRQRWTLKTQPPTHIISLAYTIILCLSLFRLLSPAYMNNPNHKIEHVTYESVCREGSSFLEKGNTDAAKQCFQLAWRMIPCRITAPFLLFNLFLENGDYNNAYTWAYYILFQQELSTVSGHTLIMKHFVREKWLALFCYLDNTQDETHSLLDN